MGAKADAAYGAYFALQIFEHMQEGRGYPDPLNIARMREEAETVAQDAEAPSLAAPKAVRVVKKKHREF